MAFLQTPQAKLSPLTPPPLPPARSAVLVSRAVAWARNLLFLGYFVFVAAVLVLRYAVLPQVGNHRDEIAAAVSRAVKAPVHIAAVTADWDGLRPRLALADVTILDPAGRIAVRLPRVNATVAWESLVVFSLRLHDLRLYGPDLEIRRDAQGELYVGGIHVEPDQNQSGGGLLGWLLGQHHIAIAGASVSWTDERRGTPTLSLSDVDFVLSRFGTLHRFALFARPPPDMASPLDIRGSIDHGLFADASDPKSWSGEVYARFDYIDLAAWHAFIDYPFSLERGAGGLRLWASFNAWDERQRSGWFPTITADVRLSNAYARLSPELPPLDLAHVSGRLSASQSAHEDEISLQNFQWVDADGLSFATPSASARRRLDAEGRTSEGEIRAARLDLASVAALGERLPLPADARALLEKAHPAGELSNLVLQWAGPEDHPDRYGISASFSGLSMAPLPNSTDPQEEIGFSDLAGTLSASQSGGNVRVTSGTHLIAPGLFAEPDIPLDHLTLNASWTLQGKDLSVNCTSFNVDNPDVAASFSFGYRHGPHSGSRGPGMLDLTGHLTRTNLTRLARYLPLTIPEEVRHYIGVAIESGTSDEATVRVRGALENYPFRNPQPLPGAIAGVTGAHEEFRIAAHVQGVRLNYAPRPAGSTGPMWPEVTDLEGDLTLDRVRLELDARTSAINGFHFDRLDAVIPDLDNNHIPMTVKGTGSGAAQAIVGFINQSPLDAVLGHLTATTHIDGAAQLDTALILPLADLAHIKVNGNVAFRDDEVSLYPWLPVLSHTNGRIDYSDSGFAVRNVNGQFLGGPLRIDSSTGADRFTLVRADGTLALAAMRRASELKPYQRLLAHADGSSRFSVAISVPPGGLDEHTVQQHGPRVVIDSTLAGVSFDVPEPMKKGASETMPLHLEFDAPSGAPGSESDLIRARLGPLQALFQRREEAGGGMEIVRAAYGLNEPATLTEARVSANLNLKTLEVDPWNAFFDSLSDERAPEAGSAGPAPLYLPDVLAARIGELKFGEKTFSDLALTATRNGPVWQANVTSPDIAGAVTWRQGAAPGSPENRITARLTRLSIPESASHEVNDLLEPSSPKSIPALDVTADDFQLSGMRLGKLELVAVNTNVAGRRVWRLQKLNLSNPDGTLEAQGLWGPAPGAISNPVTTRTRLELTINARDSGALLDRLGIKGAIKGGEALLKGDLSWRGSPLQLDYPSLSGQLHLEANKGQFLKAEPGAAKLLGVLSMQTLTRRLTLDFTDIFGGGFAYDSIRADADIVDGVATTHNFTMRGVTAVVDIDGSADLARETQNLHVHVLPQVNLGVGALGYALLVNPVIGLSTFALGEVLRDPISKALAFEYNITGPWTNPEVSKVAGTAVPATPAPPAAAAPGVPKDNSSEGNGPNPGPSQQPAGSPSKPATVVPDSRGAPTPVAPAPPSGSATSG